jgi:hypothetical protein
MVPFSLQVCTTNAPNAGSSVIRALHRLAALVGSPDLLDLGVGGQRERPPMASMLVTDTTVSIRDVGAGGDPVHNNGAAVRVIR